MSTEGKILNLAIQGKISSDPPPQPMSFSRDEDGRWELSTSFQVFLLSGPPWTSFVP